MQLLFCLETNKKADTDWVYIHETILHFYKKSQDRMRPIYMGTKMNLLQKKTGADIEKCKREYPGETCVVVCTDTDHFDCNLEQKRDNEKIDKFCREKGYLHVWFCRDIEEVYQGKTVTSKEKTGAAAQFRSTHRIRKCEEKSLSRESYAYGTSNILCVLDRLLDRKE